ncbi:MAG: Gfo/Idh/MocA family oxidoreductase, partial [Armatimonadetes bacterium]|nr:Gfo/Idh/MocA family oxidoreductase [Armatimonadota bacterium]
MRVGFIGCGGIAERRHAPYFRSRVERAQVVAVCDLSQERLKVVGDMLGVESEHWYSDYQQMLSREQLDLVDITSPHGLHEEHAVAAAHAGCHVLLEKPIARTPEEARRIILAARDREVKLCLVHNQLFTLACRKLLQIIAAGEIGRPFLVRSEMIGPRPVSGRGVDREWRTSSAGGGGGALIDSGYHQTYLARAWMGSPVKQVYASMGRFVQDYEVEDLSLVVLEHENGGLSSIQSGWCALSGGVVGMQELLATEGQARFDPMGETPLGVWRASTGEWGRVACPVEGVDELGLPALIDAVLDALEGKSVVPVTGEDSMEILHIIHAAYESARTGAPVSVQSE